MVLFPFSEEGLWELGLFIAEMGRLRGDPAKSLQTFPGGVRDWSQILPSGAQRQDKELLPQIKTN